MATIEERMKILKMIEDSKITAEEGAKLLAALADSRRTQPLPTASAGAGSAKWFRVRVTDVATGKTRVNVNLPIALVRALGDDFPIDIGRHHHGRDGWRSSRQEPVIRLGDVLAALEAGQSLVEIEDDEATIRVWVE